MGRRLLPLLAPALLAVALSGCGGDGAALDPVARAAARTGHVRSARFRLEASAEVAGSVVRLRGSGVFDGRRRRARVAFWLGSPGENARGEGALDLARGAVAYLRLPSVSVRVPGRPWVKFDLARAAREEGLDPAKVLRAVEAAHDSRRVGRERVDDVMTTRYRVEIDLERVVAALPEERRDAIEAVIRRLGSERLPLTAWVDDQGLLRRVRVQLALGPARVGLDVTLLDVGAPLLVAMPAADEVVDDIAIAAAERARARVRNAIPAIEAYNAENDGRRTDADDNPRTQGYLGMTPQRIRSYDASVDPALRVVIASRDEYCIELTVGSATAHRAGPTGAVAAGGC